MTDDEYTDAILVTMARRDGIDIQVSRDFTGGLWRVVAVAPSGERWIASDPQYPKAARMLSESMGWSFKD